MNDDLAEEAHDYGVRRSDTFGVRTFEGGTAADLRSTLQFMRDWFLRHILEADRGYSDYMNEPVAPHKTIG